MKVALSLPGDSFSQGFLKSLVVLLDYFNQKKILVDMRFHGGANINYIRNKLVPEGDYDYSLWIDSDQIFTVGHFEQLLAADKDIVSALIRTTDGNFNSGIYNEESMKKMGVGVIKLNDENVGEMTDLIRASYCGFGMVLIKKGVFEKIGSNWFDAISYEALNRVGQMGEDMSFCIRAGKAGFEVWVDPTCRVGHEKLKVLY
jgi:GT2 family glycosyltransferase